MAWWHRFFAAKAGDPPLDTDYQVAFRLYNRDATRGAEVRVLRDGRAYFIEQEHVEGTIFKYREGCEAMGPYDTPEEAELAAIRRPWFNGTEDQS